MGKHQWMGANTTWQDGIVQVWDNVAADTRFDKTQTENNKALSLDLLKRAAQLDVTVVDGKLQVKITNNSGHKLPTGYAEGRRMWIEIYQLRGATPVFTSGLMAGVVGPLISDPYLKKYEIKPGLSDAHAQAIGRPELAGEGFHIILNNKIFKDNRIPPRGFTNAAFAARDMQPVGASYVDGQYWDITEYPIHPEADSISVRLMYQTATTEYLDFLASEANFTVSDAVRGRHQLGAAHRQSAQPEHWQTGRNCQPEPLFPPPVCRAERHRHRLLHRFGAALQDDQLRPEHGRHWRRDPRRRRPLSRADPGNTTGLADRRLYADQLDHTDVDR